VKVKCEHKLGQIYEATLKLVSKEGLAGLTMNKIAQEAGIGTGTLYVYFKGKEELINDLFLKMKGRTTQCYLRGYDENEPFKVGFRKIWNNIYQDKLNEHQCSVFQEQCHTSPYISEATKTELNKLTAPFVRMMERGKQEHLVKEADTFLLLSAVMGIIVEFVHGVKCGMIQPTQENRDACFTICWDAIKQ
jgi:TetR/AcrR family transcriptional regulator, repressor of fatR-cypB operon